MQHETSVPRVCLLTETFYPVVGGGETHARMLAAELNQIGMSTFVITRRSDRWFSKTAEVEGTKVRRIPPSGMKRFGKYLMLPFVLSELFRRRREYDLIFVCGYRVLGWPAVLMARFLNKSCVLRAEALGEMSGGYASAYKKLPPLIGGLFRSWIRTRNRLLLKADGFASISKPIAEEFIEQGADPRQIFLMPNGIDTEHFSPVDDSAKSALRARLNLPKDALIASYSGKLNQGKGLEHLLNAWKELASQDNLHLALVGSGAGQALSCEENLRAFVKEHGLESRVTFTGYVDNVCEYLQASDLFIFPSENEALGIALIEAMSCGLPSIASRTGGIPEVVQHMENGILVVPGNPEALVNAVGALLADQSLAGRLAEKARRTACDRYSIQTVAEKYFEFFAKTFQERKRE